MIKLSRDAYRQAIEANIKALYLHMPRSLERDHIINVLEWSVQSLYPENPMPKHLLPPGLPDLTGTVTEDPTVIDKQDPLAGKVFFPYRPSPYPKYALSGRELCSYLHGKGANLMICKRNPHPANEPCAMEYFDSLLSHLEML